MMETTSIKEEKSSHPYTLNIRNAELGD